MKALATISLGFIVKVASTWKFNIYECASQARALSEIVRICFVQVREMKQLMKKRDLRSFDGDFSIETIGFSFTREQFISVAFAEYFISKEERDECIGRVVSTEHRKRLEEVIASTEWDNRQRRVFGEDYVIVSSTLGDDVTRKFFRNRSDGSIKLEISIKAVMMISYIVASDGKTIHLIIEHHVLKRSFTITNKIIRDDSEPLGDEEATELFDLMQAAFYKWVIKIDFDNVYSGMPTKTMAVATRAARARSPSPQMPRRAQSPARGRQLTPIDQSVHYSMGNRIETRR